MKLFCCFTPAHEVLYREHFRPSIPGTFAVEAATLAIEGPGDFLSREFLRCIAQKMDLVLASLRANEGGVIVWSDVDIRFFDVSPEGLLAELGGHDIVFQRECHATPDVNTGFLVCRCGTRLIRFFESVRRGLERDVTANEQFVVNALLRAGVSGLSWSHLPFRYYARTHGWPPPRELALYHANATAGAAGVARKLDQFRELEFLRRFGFPALVLTSLRHAPKRVARWWHGRMRPGSERGGVRRSRVP